MFTWEPFKLFHHAEYNQINDTKYMIVAQSGNKVQYGIVDLKDYTADEYKGMLTQNGFAKQFQSLSSGEKLQALAFIAFITNPFKNTYLIFSNEKNTNFDDAKHNLEHYAEQVLGISVWKEHVKEQKKEVNSIRECIQNFDKEIVRVGSNLRKPRTNGSLPIKNTL